MNNLWKKLLVIVLSFALGFGSVSVANNVYGVDEPQELIVSYEFANEYPGNAYGKINVVGGQPEETYLFYWGDAKGNKLSDMGIEYSEIGTCSTSEAGGSYQIPNAYTAIPQGATQLLAYDDEGNLQASCEIPEGKLFDEGEKKYQFALMSDVHFNRYPEENKTQDEAQEDHAVPALDNALKFINDRNIDFVALTGDLSSKGEELAYKKFNTAINKYPEMTVYTCTGNHDVSWSAGVTDNTALFKQMINTGKSKDANVKDISSNGLDFTYERSGDIFIFFSQISASYNKYTALVSPQQLTWLEKILNKYAEKNVYILFHTYFAAPDGDVTKAVGNLQNPGGYTYPLTYKFGNESEVRFRRILNKYNNVTLFSGHSHWAYEMQKYNVDLNIGNINKNKTGATLVHVSSVTEPRIIGDDDTDRTGLNGQSSEGIIATKYENSTVYTGVNFKEGKYLAYATYISKDGKKGKPEPIITTGKTSIKSISKPKKMSKKSKKYQTTVRYKAVSGAAGYQIQYSTSKKFITKKTKTKVTKKIKYTIQKLNGNTRYYVRVRAYKWQFGERVYGKFTKPKAVKIKASVKKRNKK